MMTIVITFIAAFSLPGCFGAKAAKHKAKMVTPGVDAKGENAMKEVREVRD
jgi:hypothetical protein